MLTQTTLAFNAKVVHVVDGDTITVRMANWHKIKVRLAGIDAPEKAQVYGQQSTQLLSFLILGKYADIRPRVEDKFGRLVGDVYVDGHWVNEMMVARGAAWVYRIYANQDKDKLLYQAEFLARKANYGLWGLPIEQRMAPWLWRKTQLQSPNYSRKWSKKNKKVPVYRVSPKSKKTYKSSRKYKTYRYHPKRKPTNRRSH